MKREIKIYKCKKEGNYIVDFILNHPLTPMAQACVTTGDQPSFDIYAGPVRRDNPEGFDYEEEITPFDKQYPEVAKELLKALSSENLNEANYNYLVNQLKDIATSNVEVIDLRKENKEDIIKSILEKIKELSILEVRQPIVSCGVTDNVYFIKNSLKGTGWLKETTKILGFILSDKKECEEILDQLTREHPFSKMKEEIFNQDNYGADGFFLFCCVTP